MTATQAAILARRVIPTLPASGNWSSSASRGRSTFAGYGLFDMSLNYNVPVFRTLRPWVKFDVFNLFNNEKLIAWNTTITQNPAASPEDSLGLATDYTKGATFGNGDRQHGDEPVTSDDDQHLSAGVQRCDAGGRTVRVAVGFRF